MASKTFRDDQPVSATNTAPSFSRSHLDIVVSEDDLKSALRNNSTHCAVAQAVARNIPNAERVSVDIQTIRFSDKATGERLIYLTPSKVQKHIIAFDAGDPLVPFSFGLKHPTWVTKQRKQVYEGVGSSVDVVASNDPVLADTSTALTLRTEADIEQGTPRTVVVRSKRVSAPPTSRRASRRSYGLRAMRINQGYNFHAPQPVENPIEE